MTTINYEAEVDQDLTAIGKELEKNLYNSEAWAAKADILCSIRMHEIAIRCCDRSLAVKRWRHTRAASCEASKASPHENGTRLS